MTGAGTARGGTFISCTFGRHSGVLTLRVKSPSAGHVPPTNASTRAYLVCKACGVNSIHLLPTAPALPTTTGASFPMKEVSSYTKGQLSSQVCEGLQS